MTTQDRRSPEAQAYRAQYKTARWRTLRHRQLSTYPLCERHLKQGEIVAATVCHHVDPKTKEHLSTFFTGPFESLCAPCHDGPAQQVERIGFSSEIGLDGWPLDPAHPANAN